MPSEIIVALIVCAGTVIGSIAGSVLSSSLTRYRIQQLEQKVDEHNKVVTRTFLLERDMKVANHRIEDLEEITK